MKINSLLDIYDDLNERYKISQKFVVLLLLTAFGAGIATYSAFTNAPLLGQNSRKIIHLLNFDLIILLLLGFLISRRIIKLWFQKRSGRAGSKLHLRLALIFGALTVLPTLFIAVSSAFLFNEGIQIWFNERVRTALNESSAVAGAYLEEHKKAITTSVGAMALKFSENFGKYAANPQYFSEELDSQCYMMSLNEGMIFGLNHQIYARTRLSFSLEFESLSFIDLQRSRENIVLQTSESGDRVRAFTRIPNTDAFLIVGRYLDRNVFKRIANTRNAVSEYNQLESLQSRLEVKLAVSFIIVALILLLAAIWMGLRFAGHLAKPISELIRAAESVRMGNYSIRVSEKTSDDEISILSRAFNRMTSELLTQQKELYQANQQIDQRRQFIEDVLGGVTAGVIELSVEGNIRLLNRSAADLLSLEKESQIGKSIEEVMPEMVDYLAQAFKNHDLFCQAELTVSRQGITKTLLIRVVLEYSNNKLWGFIITFDDITKLITAQKKAAWSDVAQRIAHEIKNPLTPIQLSAERLRRKYLKQIISEDQGHFQTCIDTIVRQVNQMEHLVSEFSSFARMPNSKMSSQDLIILCKQAIDLQKSAYPDIEFHLSTTERKLLISCDSSQLSQVLTNLLKNAIDSIESLKRKKREKIYKGIIIISVKIDERKLKLIIEDNGEGLPDNKAQLLDPYFTLREKGTGLGLAIVKKIVEDHLGILQLENRSEGGAWVIINFPLEILIKDQPHEK